MRRTNWVTVGCVLVLCACGASQKAAPSGSEGDVEDTEVDDAPDDGPMVSPEKYDEIRSSFNMRRSQAARCYRKAVDDGVVKEEAGHVTIGLTVTAEGKTKNVHIAETTLKVKAVEDCIVGLVSSWDLPPPGAEIQFSYAYKFEPNW